MTIKIPLTPKQADLAASAVCQLYERVKESPQNRENAEELLRAMSALRIAAAYGETKNAG